ncbi:MAG: PEP-CTERM sorting domain-containing protein [Methyloversatilis sp.]|nr:PEP-CTERM sorting domain-containing protein [Methyloversatilis sp.]
MEFEAFVSFTATRVPAGLTVSGDLSNTAFLKLILPQELTLVESGSGTFGVAIPVPEPQVHALMLAGLAFVGAVVARRKRA